MESENKDGMVTTTEVGAKDYEEQADDDECETEIGPNNLSNLLYRSEKFRNSPIIHRRSRFDEILSIPDVAAALGEGDAAMKFTGRMRHKDKIAQRLPSPAYPKAQRGLEDLESPSNHFKFSFDREEFESESDTVPQSPTTPSADPEDCNSTASSSESSRNSADSTSMVVQEAPVENSHDISNDKSAVYDIIGDSSVPIRTAKMNGKDTSMFVRRLSQNIDGTDTSLVAILESKDGNNEAVHHTPAPVPEPEANDKPHIEDYYDTYNRPTLSERRMQSKLRLLKNKSESQGTILTWESLARAIARVRRCNSTGEESDYLLPEPVLTPILKQDPASKPTIRKKTVSFSRLPSEALVKNAADCVQLMQTGHQFVKMRSNARIYNRFYWFDVTTNCLRWEPSKKDAGKAKIDISSIKEVRPGKATELFLSSDISSHFPEECAFSVIYADYKNLDLIAGSVDEANIWITGLRCLLGGQDAEELQTRRDTRDTWLSTVFESADINGDGYLDEEESLELLKRLSDGIREIRIKQKLTEFLRFKDRDRTRLTKDEFVELFKDVTTRPEIYFLLARHASGDDRLTVDDLMLFLESEQGLPDVTRESCIDLIERFEPSLELKAIPAFGIDGFTKYLMSRECNIFDPAHSQVCQDMSQPLAHYFIASSHNTYLMEDQLCGPSSVSAYVRALLRCCRCIELDCWDGQDGKPVVMHGHTQSNSINFEQVIEAVKECAFKNSPYPVILCIENHCSLEQQKLMATVLKTVLGDQIYTEQPSDEAEDLPSPDSLKYRFLIKSKKLPPDVEGDDGEVTDEDEGAAVKEKVPPSPYGNPQPFSIGPGLLLSRKIEEEEEEEPPARHRLARELSDLVSLCVSTRMSENDTLAARSKSRRFYEVTSVEERTAMQLATKSPEEYVSFNKKSITRVHPSALRIDSSNFNPQDFWNCGVQIASLNYQTPGLMMDINDGRFAMNGGCGYVLKPAIMRDEVAYFSASHTDVIPSIPPKILHLRVISGQEFPKPRGGGAKGHVIDPYVLLELFGMTADCSEQRTRTSHDCGSGNSTALFDETFEFRLTVPDLALLRFVVLDDDFIGDEFIGQYTIPFECLRPGYRHLRLRSIFDEPLEDATLFVHIAITDGSMPMKHSSSLTNMANNVSSGGMVSSPTAGPPGILTKKRTSSSSLLPKRSKKSQQQQQVRKERAASVMRVVGVRKIDDTFQTAIQPLRHAADMREKLHRSKVFFKEMCGLTALSSIKQCVRNLAIRINVEAQQVPTGKKPTRKGSIDVGTVSLAPVNGVGSQGTPVLKCKDKSNQSKGTQNRTASDGINMKNDSTGKLSLRMVLKDGWPVLEIYNLVAQPPSAADMWKKVLVGFQCLVADAKYVIDNATPCQESLGVILKEALRFHENLPALIKEESVITEGSPVAGSPATQKKSKMKKGRSEKPKRTPSGDLFPGKNTEWDFAWNCSVIRGHLDQIKSSHREAEAVLSHLRDAGIASGLATEEELSKNSLKKSDSALSNSGSDMSRDSGGPGQDDQSSESDSSSQQNETKAQGSLDNGLANKNNNNGRGGNSILRDTTYNATAASNSIESKPGDNKVKMTISDGRDDEEPVVLRKRVDVPRQGPARGQKRETGKKSCLADEPLPVTLL